MARYYLVPFEMDKDIKSRLGYTNGQCPKYLAELGNAKGVISLDEAGKPYYIIVIEDDKQDMSKFESHAEVKKLDSKFEKIGLESVGIDTSAMKAIPSVDEIEQELTKWLINETKTLRTL
jgi:hypothetical protein